MDLETSYEELLKSKTALEEVNLQLSRQVARIYEGPTGLPITTVVEEENMADSSILLRTQYVLHYAFVVLLYAYHDCSMLQHF